MELRLGDWAGCFIPKAGQITKLGKQVDHESGLSIFNSYRCLEVSFNG